MSTNRMKLGALVCVVAVGIAVASTAGAARQSTPGVTASQVTIGSTFPLTGGASGYATIAYAEEAYYNYINAKGGVHGRTIHDIVEDDQYDPSQTVGDVQDLVQNKNVFAIVGSLGTAPAFATWNYLNNNSVPQVLLATGDSYWGDCVNGCNIPALGGPVSPKPWTEGWQPTYPAEAKLYAKYILAKMKKSGKFKKTVKVGILSQDDLYGDNYVAGLKAGLGNKQSIIVKQEKYSFGDSAQVIAGHLAALQQAGVNTLFIFATPTASIQALGALHALGWNPLTFLNNVSANRLFMLYAEAHGATPNGVISSSYIQSQTATPNAKGMKLAQTIIHNYAPGGVGSLDSDFAAGDNNLIYGLAVAYTFVDALNRAGANPTRQSLMAALRSLNESGKKKSNPFVIPGIAVKTSTNRPYPMEQLQLEQWNGTTHDWKAFGQVGNVGF